MFIDSHCHLDPYSYELENDAEIQAIIKRAREAGISALITVVASVKTPTLVYAAKLAEENNDIYFIAGIHPHEAALATPELYSHYDKGLNHPKALALGEIGLDYFYDFSTPDEQRQVFRYQLNMAKRLNKPVACHIREAHAEAQIIMKEEYSDRPALIHCFSGTYEEAKIYLDMGYYLSAPGIITFKNAASLRETFKKLPTDRVLLETDSPFLAPIPYRGRPNEPAFMLKTAECLADLWDMTMNEIAAVTTANCKKFFKLN